MNKLNLAVSFNRIPIELTQEDGSVLSYELREMVAAERDLHLDSLRTRMALDGSGKPIGVKKFEGMQADLLARCLFLGDKKVTREQIQAWPASLVQRLYDAAQEINGLNREPGEITEESKNG